MVWLSPRSLKARPAVGLQTMRCGDRRIERRSERRPDSQRHKPSQTRHPRRSLHRIPCNTSFCVCSGRRGAPGDIRRPARARCGRPAATRHFRLDASRSIRRRARGQALLPRTALRQLQARACCAGEEVGRRAGSVGSIPGNRCGATRASSASFSRILTGRMSPGNMSDCCAQPDRHAFRPARLTRTHSRCLQLLKADTLRRDMLHRL